MMGPSLPSPSPGDPGPVNFPKAQGSQLEEFRVLYPVSPHLAHICCATRYLAFRESPSVRVQGVPSDCEEGLPGSTTPGGVIFVEHPLCFGSFPI